MSLLDKISAVEVRADTRISEADRAYCQAHQKAYDDARIMLIELRELWRTFVDSQTEILKPIAENTYETDRYFNVEGLSTSSIQRKINVLPEVLVGTIVEYFNGKYRVSVSSQDIKDFFIPKQPEFSWEKSRSDEYNKIMDELTLKYEDILEQIFVQLGGRTFEERALDELKKKCHDFAWDYYKQSPDYTVKNDTVQFIGYACSCSQSYRGESWSIRGGMKNILTAVAHFETGQLENIPTRIEFLIGYDNKYESIYEFDYEKLKRIRMYKNSRVDLKFASKEYANEFAECYLGLVV